VTVIGLDPGPHYSALVSYDGTVGSCTILSNAEIRGVLHVSLADVLVIEEVQSYGMAVGKDVFQTVFESGRLAAAWEPRKWHLLGRRDVKVHLCHSARATDSNLRQALVDRFGPSREAAMGTKKAPGPLYGIKSHLWAALAIAVTWHDLFGATPPEIRSGVVPEW